MKLRQIQKDNDKPYYEFIRGDEPAKKRSKYVKVDEKI